uniref:NADH dehydrogenase subunit 11 n=1 Tax=Ophirina amphinema TaxID=2108040 RepID=A0A348AYQ4_9EUKA|nr:NADH dehydrogenase subunit 11 [Ophirina amphinema]
MTLLTVNGKSVSVPNGSTVIQACELAGVEVPKFCYHPRLSIAGNCRMCLVELKGSKKPIASCAMPVGDGMDISTDTPLVKKAREGVLELLLVNHPLDCPICDQGGECDLQDQAMVFGSDRGRFSENKRGVADKNLGPLIKTIMTRCIHCTRCIRFATEIAGVEDLGTTGRGKDTEVGTYVDKFFDSEMSGNVIDLCPVGALTSKPYAFIARPWELDSTDSIDVMDATGSNIVLQTRGSGIVRVIPRENDGLNQEWIGDKTRFSYDGLLKQRIQFPYIRKDGRLMPVDWLTVLNKASGALSGVDPSQVVGLMGKFVDVESAFLMKRLFLKLGARNLVHDSSLSAGGEDFRENFIFNRGVKSLEKADCFYILSSDTRKESPVVNARIRSIVRKNNAPVFYVGAENNSTYDKLSISDVSTSMVHISQGRHQICSLLPKYKSPVLILGSGLFDKFSMPSLINMCGLIKAQVPQLNISVLHFNASHVGISELGKIQTATTKSDLFQTGKALYVLGDVDLDISKLRDDTLVIYQGTHGSEVASRADIILPGSTHVEKSSLYLNTEGRPQITRRALPSFGEIRNDFDILRALTERVCGSASQANELENLENYSPLFISANRGELPETFNPLFSSKRFGRYIQASKLNSSISNYYLSDSISRSSSTMLKCSKLMKWQVV